MRWLTIFILAAHFWPASADAAVFVLDDFRDWPRQSGLSDPCACVSINNTCTLRAAVETANACPGADEIQLDHPGPYRVDRWGQFEDFAFTGDLDVRDDLRVVATNGHQIQATNLNDRLFHVPASRGASTVLELVGVTLENGTAPSLRNGGGVLVETGRLELVDSTVTQCEANAGGGVAASNAKVAIRKSTLIDNRATDGGGLFADESEVVVFDSFVRLNDATNGGGIFVRGSAPTIVEGTEILHNQASRAGGGAWFEAPTTFVRSQLRGNLAVYGGGALVYRAVLTGSQADVFSNVAVRDGAGLYGHDGARIELDHSSLYDNVASMNGGGVYTRSLLYFFNTSIHDNEARSGAAFCAKGGSSFAFANNASIANNVPINGFGIDAQLARLRNTIVENNVADCSANVFSLGNVVSPDPACLAGGASGNVSAFANVTPTTIGTSRILTLAAGSVAIDAGNNATCESDDQRFVSRPQGPSCDVGAYELQ